MDLSTINLTYVTSHEALDVCGSEMVEVQALVLFLGCMAKLLYIVARNSYTAKIEQLQDEAKATRLILKQKEVRSWPRTRSS
eukprot:437813-Pyramimonas_sp.AAC.1